MRWGSGSLQEIDHLPFVAPLVKGAETVRETGAIGPRTAAALDLALSAPYGPAFVDYPLDVVFSEAEAEIPGVEDEVEAQAAPGVEEAAALLAAAERPAIMAGSGLYWGHGEGELRALAEALALAIKNETDFVAEVASSAEAAEVTEREKPGVVLLAVDRPG